MNKMYRKRYGGGKRNLFILTMNTYNNERAIYEIIPLRDSDIKRSVVFAGRYSKNIISSDNLGPTCLYLETEEEINENNYYKNVQRLLNLIWLATCLPVEYLTEDIEEYNNFESLYDDYKCNIFYNPNIIHGLVSDRSPISRVASYSMLMQKLKNEDFKKFDNSLNTYTWAQEIERLPNFHLKYTLYMMLYLSSIDQLANASPIICNGNIVCEECGTKISKMHETSRISEIEKLVKNLLTGNNVNNHVEFIKRHYGKLRSAFLHHGIIRGFEKEGGFLFGASSEKQKELLEDMINIKMLNRKLLELFLNNRQIKNNY